MSFAALEKEVQRLPMDLQANIEMYALFIINKFKHSSSKNKKTKKASEILDGLSGIIPFSKGVTMKSIREERLHLKAEM